MSERRKRKKKKDVEKYEEKESRTIAYYAEMTERW